jgi:hypothetical protein
MNVREACEIVLGDPLDVIMIARTATKQGLRGGVASAFRRSGPCRLSHA